MIREKNPKMKTDMVLLILVLLLAVFGLIMLFSISEYMAECVSATLPIILKSSFLPLPLDLWQCT